MEDEASGDSDSASSASAASGASGEASGQASGGASGEASGERSKSGPPSTRAFHRSVSFDPSEYRCRRSSAARRETLERRRQQQQQQQQQQRRVTWSNDDNGHGGAYTQSASSPSVVLKALQMLFSVLCLALWCEGAKLAWHSESGTYFPFIVFTQTIIVNGVILFGYAAGMKMREMLMRMFSAVGAALFAASGLLTASTAAVLWRHWQATIDEGPTDEDPLSHGMARRRAYFMLVAHASFVAALLFALDVCYSYRRTFALL